MAPPTACSSSGICTFAPWRFVSTAARVSLVAVWDDGNIHIWNLCWWCKINIKIQGNICTAYYILLPIIREYYWQKLTTRGYKLDLLYEYFIKFCYNCNIWKCIQLYRLWRYQRLKGLMDNTVLFGIYNFNLLATKDHHGFFLLSRFLMLPKLDIGAPFHTIHILLITYSINASKLYLWNMTVHILSI